MKRDEKTIRILYGDLLHEKLLKEILEEKIIVLMQTQTEYELVKEKTGVIVCDGKVISNERKDNEIMILRTENSTLKNVVNDKEKEIDLLNEKIKLLNREVVKLRKNKTNINININDMKDIFHSKEAKIKNEFPDNINLIDNSNNLSKQAKREIYLKNRMKGNIDWGLER